MYEWIGKMLLSEAQAYSVLKTTRDALASGSDIVSAAVLQTD